MQFSEKYCRAVVMNRPCIFKYEDWCTMCEYFHQDHSVTVFNCNKFTGEVTRYKYFMSYKDVFNFYTEYSLIYALPYPEQDIYYHIGL